MNCTQIIGVSEEEEKKKGYEKIFEGIIVENFPNMEKEIFKQESTVEYLKEKNESVSRKIKWWK